MWTSLGDPQQKTKEEEVRRDKCELQTYISQTTTEASQDGRRKADQGKDVKRSKQ